MKYFSCLKTGSNSWIYRLMQTYNDGNVAQFNLDVQEFSEQINSNPVLSTNKHTLDDKIKIMAFLELIFTLPKNDRTVTFTQISERCSLNVNVVELMVLKAMSLELIKGSIDQVGQNVTVNFIQPRVLDKARIGTMRDKFADWQKSLADLLKVLEKHQESLC